MPHTRQEEKRPRGKKKRDRFPGLLRGRCHPAHLFPKTIKLRTWGRWQRITVRQAPLPDNAHKRPGNRRTAEAGSRFEREAVGRRRESDDCRAAGKGDGQAGSSHDCRGRFERIVVIDPGEVETGVGQREAARAGVTKTPFVPLPSSLYW